jgi:hypothetical protein
MIVWPARNIFIDSFLPASVSIAGDCDRCRSEIFCGLCLVPEDVVQRREKEKVEVIGSRARWFSDRFELCRVWDIQSPAPTDDLYTGRIPSQDTVADVAPPSSLARKD